MRVPRSKANLLLLVLSGFLIAATGVEVRADLSSSQARKALTRMAGFNLKSSAVRVKSVSANSASAANATADIRMVFKFQADKDGKWHVDEIRTGQDSWEEVELISAALGAAPDYSGCNAPDPPFKRKDTSDPSVKRSRCLIGNLLGIDVPSDAVRIQEVNQSPFPASAPSAIVVAWVRVDAQLLRDKSGWHVAELRTGNRSWVKLEEVTAALDREKQQHARDEMALIATALEKLRQERGSYVVSDSHAVAINFLTPRYLGRVIRVDPWNQPYKYFGDRDHFTLRSLGPDGKADTPDDIISQSR